jgi:hypothetical protein
MMLVLERSFERRLKYIPFPPEVQDPEIEQNRRKKNKTTAARRGKERGFSRIKHK